MVCDHCNDNKEKNHDFSRKFLVVIVGTIVFGGSGFFAYEYHISVVNPNINHDAQLFQILAFIVTGSLGVLLGALSNMFDNTKEKEIQKRAEENKRKDDMIAETLGNLSHAMGNKFKGGNLNNYQNDNTQGNNNLPKRYDGQGNEVI